MRNAWLVGAGILMSRLAGLVRLRVFAHFFGLRSEAADAFSAAFRVPNLLQNLFGEGALSGSFIPVYASLIARGEHDEADRLARAVASLLALAMAVLVALGIACAPWLVAVVAPGFEGQQRDLTTLLVRVLFPGMGLLVLSAWCLGVLNSHQKFLLSYAAPVVWNAAMIVALLVWGPGSTSARMAVVLAWGAVVGSALQMAVQLPVVARHVRLRPTWDTASRHVRSVAANFAPVLVGRGVVQISAYVDTMIASLLPTGAVTGLFNAQMLYTLPVSLFGMSMAASELPAMAGAADLEGQDVVRRRLEAALHRVAVFVVPSAAAFLAFGDLIAAALLQTGRFTAADADLVWGILAGSAVGLLPSTFGRLYATTAYAMRDTKAPLRFAIVRVALATLLGYTCAIVVPRAMGVPAIWGAAGLTFGSGLAAWVELRLLRRALARQIGPTRLAQGQLARLCAAALGAALGAWAIRWTLAPAHPVVSAAVILLPFGAAYLGLAAALGAGDIRSLIGRRGR